MQSQMPLEETDEGRFDCGRVVTVAWKAQTGVRPPYTKKACRKEQPCPFLTLAYQVCFGPLASRTVREEIHIDLSHQSSLYFVRAASNYVSGAQCAVLTCI